MIYLQERKPASKPDVDGVPLAMDPDLDGIPIDHPIRGTPRRLDRNIQEEKIEDLDGAPLTEDLDGEPCM